MKREWPNATDIVLLLLCLMYLITYVDRVNIATAADFIRRDLHLSVSQLGIALSAFGYPYLLFQVFGGWIGDRFGPRRTLFLCGLVWTAATVLTGFAGSLASLFAFRVLVGVGEGATFPVATRAMQSWLPPGRRGFGQGLTHAFARFGNAITPPIVAALMLASGWRGAFYVLGAFSLMWVIGWIVYFRDNPADHPAISGYELDQLRSAESLALQRRSSASLSGERGVSQRRSSASLSGERVEIPWGALTARMLPVTIVYFCYGWTLWLYLNWLPSFFLNEYKLDIRRSALFSSAVFFAGVVGDTLGGVVSDRILKATGDLRRARRDVVIVGFLGAFVCLLAMFATRDLTLITLSLGAGFFFAEIVIGPMWAIPMDIAPEYSGTASGLMNTGSALAAILSPLAFGYITDATGNWHLPFAGSLGLLLLGAVLAPTMHPEKPLVTVPST